MVEQKLRVLSEFLEQVVRIRVKRQLPHGIDAQCMHAAGVPVSANISERIFSPRPRALMPYSAK